MKVKVYFKTVGCRVNQVETESLREKFASLGHQAAESPEEADLVVLNTCSVTAKADRDCLAFLRRTAAANPGASIAVTGCLATLEPGKILAAVPGAALFSNKDKESIPAALCGTPAAADFFSVTKFQGKARAFIKVQDGCDLKCAYCLVNIARNELRSKPSAAAVAEIRALAAGGFAEIVLCGTRLGIYKCPVTGTGLAGLLERVFALPGDFRVRFSSIESQELTPELLRVLKAAGPRFCDYFHLPLQAGADPVLKAMGRLYGTARYRDKVEELRSIFPGVGVYADIIAGYPSETEEDFAAALSYVRELGLSGLHVFSFSARPGTRAAALKALPPGTVAARSASLRALDAQLRAAFAASMLGRETLALVLRNKDGRALALASNFVNLEIAGPQKAGTLLRCRITAARQGVCLAEKL
ncbi:MAG: MiaB/RimO family radical SAM methylthiotransferase [Elusimicrobiales bacterium]|nr:MiaB/RimO family radical SAM methylthiotransferase [Elusimicrobiales bacterium]